MSSFVEYSASGSTAQFAITFGYLDTTHVKVTVDGVADNSLTFPNAATVQLSSTPAAAAVVRVYRETPISSKLTTFSDGSVLTAEDLNNSDLQMLYALQERLGFNSDGDGWDALDLVIENLGPPIVDTDAATKKYVDDTITSELADFSLENTEQVEWEYVSRVADITAESPVGRAAFFDLNALWDYKFVGRNWVSPYSNSPSHTQGLKILVSPDAGTSPTWDETSGDYAYFVISNGGAGTNESMDDATDGSTLVKFGERLGPDSITEFAITLNQPGTAGVKTTLSGEMFSSAHCDSNAADQGPGSMRLSAERTTAQADKAIMFEFINSPTGATSGVVDMYRRKINWDA